MIRAAAIAAVAAVLGSPALPAAATYCNDAAGLAHVRKARAGQVAQLRARKFAELDTFYGGLQRAYEDGAKSDAELVQWFHAFDTPDARLTPLLEEWVGKHPKSYAARRALAEHLHAAAWAKRGGKVAAQTSEEQFAGMQRELERMIDVLNAADPLTAKPIASYRLRINLAKSLAGNLAVEEAFERAERIDPHNATAKAAFVHALSPKWGGDERSLVRLAARIEQGPWSADLKNYVRYEYAMMWADVASLAGKASMAKAQLELAARHCPAFAPNIAARLERLSQEKGK